MNVAEMVTRIRRNCTVFGDQFPTVGAGTQYELGPNNNWLAAFWAGLVWLAYAEAQTDDLRTYAEGHLASFTARLDNRVHITHDLGFLYTLSARAQWQLTGAKEARALALRAARALAKRFNRHGKFIQAWDAVGVGENAGRAIIDTMMNIPLLFWMADQTGKSWFREIACQHADTTAQYLIREDGGSHHTYFFDPATVDPLRPKTHQGYADDSLWARGQAWVIFGFAVAADWTGEARYAEIARRGAERFMAELPANHVPLWDLRLPDDALQAPDTSASAIAASGMLRLARLLDGDAGAQMRQGADLLLDSLRTLYLETDPQAQGLLRGGTYHAHKRWGVNEYFICGDYFFFEALLLAADRAPDFWGPPS
ncbi:MAG: glycoside hydrolase family 88 protein [Anaerolineae bacterium]|nr:glycoside hydrolase family 88 protein [Anaerolineae bacterium]